ncbi:hypothetical protein [Enterococcus wangshanyuanii]|uniref:Uncharacterized protein n=1 Tax=Enterococcus wangshanyuanii TaxID=2005703 RepID=A0ABQ1PTE2_9ENTE|nr:hypothetical protein [Enterococcus wangshanyuanii]GGD03319.1 hypothetical protein GCM10011573_35980 [Enterococcus wangshanyuanii]
MSKKKGSKKIVQTEQGKYFKCPVLFGSRGVGRQEAFKSLLQRIERGEITI